MTHLGIDPGLGGGIAVILESGTALAYTMPATERDLWDCLNTTLRPCHATLEKVGVMPKQGIVSAFTFGKGYGSLLMALTAAQIPFDLVTPQTWQKALGCLSKGDKTVTKRRAQQLFPQLTINHAIADALLLAEFGRRMRDKA